MHEEWGIPLKLAKGKQNRTLCVHRIESYTHARACTHTLTYTNAYATPHLSVICMVLFHPHNSFMRHVGWKHGLWSQTVFKLKALSLTSWTILGKLLNLSVPGFSRLLTVGSPAYASQDYSKSWNYKEQPLAHRKQYINICYYFSLLSRRLNWGRERLSNFLKVTRLEKVRDRT